MKVFEVLLRYGFRILGDGLGIGDGILAINVFGGICIGRWSKLRLIFWFMVEMY